MTPEQKLIEQLADKEHASWARWMNYLFSRGSFTMHGDLVIPMALTLKWKIQAHTPYERLSEQEKQSDRDEVAHILPIIYAYWEGNRENETVEELLEQALSIDGVCHKQWYLWRIAEMLKIELPDDLVDKGIAP